MSCKEEEIETFDILGKYLREFKSINCNISRYIDSMCFEHGYIEKNIMSDDNCITNKISYTFSDGSPFFTSFEHLSRDSCDHSDFFLELSIRVDEHGSLFTIDDEEFSIPLFEFKTNSSNLDNRICFWVESCGFEIECNKNHRRCIMRNTLSKK